VSWYHNQQTVLKFPHTIARSYLTTRAACGARSLTNNRARQGLGPTSARICRRRTRRSFMPEKEAAKTCEHVRDGKSGSLR
jgi:hypothetical protein